VSDDRHDEIATRLRAEAGARAPERLQADVMLRVRAEPRPRRIRRRRTYWRPLGSLAAAACLLGAAVLGISHLSLSGGGSASGGGSSATALERAAPLGVGAGGATASTGTSGSVPAPSAVHGSTVPTRQDAAAAAYAQKLLEYRAFVKRVPRPLRYAVAGRLRLESALPKALGTLDLHRGGGSRF
jgi:hypothetical protein